MTSVESQLSVFTPSLVSLHLSPSLAGGVRLVGCVSSPVSPHLSSVVSLYLFLLFLSFVSQCASAARLSGCSGVWLSASLSVPVSPHLSPRLASGVRLSRCLSLLVSLRLSGCVSFLVSLHSFPNVPMLVSGSLFPGCPGVIGRAAPRMSFFTCLLLCHAVRLSGLFICIQVWLVSGSLDVSLHSSPFICLPLCLVVSSSSDVFLCFYLSHQVSLAMCLPVYLSPNQFVSNQRSALVVVSGFIASSPLCVFHHLSLTICLLLHLSPKSSVSHHMSALVAVSCSSSIMISFVFRVCLCS